MIRAAIVTIAVALTLAWTLAAGADVCPPSGSPWLRVAFRGEALTPALEARILEQLGADLRGHGIALCGETPAAPEGATGAPAPLADIAIALSADAALSLEVSDAVTGKHVLRDLPLRAVPRDALALSIALAAQELLHASWIEAALVPPPAAPAPAVAPVPPEVREIDAAEVARMSEAVRGAASAGASERARGSMTEVSLLAAADAATGGESDLGGDLRLAWGRRFTIGARAGFRVDREASSTHGVVHGRQLLVGAGVGYALVRREARVGAELGLRADLFDVQFSGSAAPGAVGTSGAQLAAVASGRVGAWLGLGGPWRVIAEGAAGAPLRPVTASDAGHTVTGLSGATFGVALGLGVLVP